MKNPTPGGSLAIKFKLAVSAFVLILGVVSMLVSASVVSKNRCLNPENLSFSLSGTIFDGYMYLSLVKNIDEGNISDARSLAVQNLKAKIVELQQLQDDLSITDQEAAKRLIQRVEEYRLDRERN